LILEELQAKHPLVYRDATIDIYMEQHSIGNIIHCISKKWDKSVAQHLHGVLDLVIEQYNIEKLYCMVLPEDVVLYKFAEMYGFVDEHIFVEDSDGNNRRLMQCLI